MFKRIVNHKGFWKSVLVLGLMYSVLLYLLQWAFTGFNEAYTKMGVLFYFGVLLAGFIVGFSMAYAKFYGKLKREDLKK